MDPKLPSLRDLTRQLRELHDAFAHPMSGGEFVGLTDIPVGKPERVYAPVPVNWPDGPIIGREYIPGDGAPFDAVAAARRLLAAVKDAQT